MKASTAKAVRSAPSRPASNADERLHRAFRAVNAVDNNSDTYWHSNWNPPGPELPHSLVIEPRQPVTASGFILTPRMACDHGRIARCRIHASDDGKRWKSIAEGAWENSDRPQTVELDSPTTARFFKLEALQEVRNRDWTSVAEFDVLTR